jgi:TolB protein
MIRFRRPLALALCGLLLPVPLPAVAQERLDVEIIGSANKPFQVALQRFASDGKNGELVDPFYEDLKNALEEAGAFKVVKPDAFLESVVTLNLDEPRVSCDNWKAIGADILVQGKLEQPGEDRERQRVRYRVWDLTPCQEKGDPRFLEARREDMWLVARKVADEIVQRFTGYRGVAATQLAFVSRQEKAKEVWIMEADGSRKRKVTSNGFPNSFPAWSSTGQELLYMSLRGGFADLWRLTRGTGKPGLLFSGGKIGGMEKYRGIFGPTENDFTLVMHTQNNTDIYVVSKDGKNVKRLTDNKAIEVSPAWSPDRKQLAFASDRSGQQQIYVMDVESGDVRRLTFQGTYNATPAWSPTGEWIAYAARTGYTLNLDLYLIDPTSGYTVPLVIHPQTDEDPAWAPNGRKLAFSSARRGRREIYTLDLDGGNLRRLTENFGENASPAWSTWLD